MTTPLSDIDLAAMRAREQKATPGPWDYDHMHFEIHAPHDDNYWVVVSEECNVPNDAPVDQFGHQYSPDYEFIAAARTDMPDLLDEVERLRSWLRECSVAMGGDGSDDSLLGLVYCCGAGNEALKQIGREQAEVDRLRARVAALEALLRSVEWQGRSEWDYDYAFCPECQSPENDGHAPDCELAAVLREAG